MNEPLYAIISNDYYLLENEANKIIKQLEVDDFNVLSYDLETQGLDELYIEIMTISFLNDPKVIKIKNPWFFYEVRKDEDLSSLIKYFKNPKENTTLIFLLEKEIDNSIDVSKEAMKYLRFEHIEQIKKEDLFEYVKNLFLEKNYKIEDISINALLERTNYNLPTIISEVNKICIYAHDSKEITVEDIERLVPRNLEDNIFELSTAVVEKNKVKALEIYYDLIIKNIDPVSIISTLANKLKETITTKHLLEKKYSQKSVADYFNVSYGRAYYMVKNAKLNELVILNNYYDSLAELDFKIKSGQIDKKLGLELWLLEGLDA